MSFFNLFFGIVLVGALSFETVIRSDFSRNLQSDCIQNLTDQVFHSEKGDNKFLKSKVLVWFPAFLDNYLTDHDFYNSTYRSFSDIVSRKQNRTDHCSCYFLLPSVMDLPPPISLFC